MYPTCYINLSVPSIQVHTCIENGIQPWKLRGSDHQLDPNDENNEWLFAVLGGLLIYSNQVL